MRDVLNVVSPELPVLIAGPTASGKSALALEIAKAQGGIIINADALQVFANWRVLTARPSDADLNDAPHALYGHVPGNAAYSVGHWLRDLKPYLVGPRPIIVGGTGLYFSALTEGLAEIPRTPPEIRRHADSLPTDRMLAELDVATRARIDTLNPVRIQRAWEVLRATGRGLADWQDETPNPLMPLDRCTSLVLEADKDWLNARIEARFDRMMSTGALDEARANLETWDPTRPSAKAIGALALIEHIQGKRDLKDAVLIGKTLTRQYAKRQRTWFRSRMRTWRAILMPRPDLPPT